MGNNAQTQVALLVTLLMICGPLPAAPQTPDTGPAKKTHAPNSGPTDPTKDEDPEVKALRKRIELLRLKQQELQLRNSIEDEKLKKQLAKLRAEGQILRAQNAKDLELLNQKNANFQKEKNRISLELQRIGLKNTRLNLEKAELQARLAALQIRIQSRRQREIWRNVVSHDAPYTTKPFVNGKLLVSDRRIELDGPIYYDLAERVVSQINFYNNKSEKYPIFLVINNSPGGSVMAGHRILAAMDASRAPVIVVVKSYAASMAAVIAALAPTSYALPNAIILHHQVSTVGRGNLTQQKERIELAQEWMRRLATPVAKKMGLSLKEFVARMYKNNSDGDWREFADRAVALKWIGATVPRIEEQSVRTKPSKAPARRLIFFERTDDRGHRYVQLPRLEPYDMHFLHNVDGYYRP